MANSFDRHRGLRGALVGYGFIMEHGHASAYRLRTEKERDVEIVAIADICEARRRKAQQDFPAARVYADSRSLLEAEAGKLDFVDIATPPADHASVALDALAAGLHVLCEKPLSTTIEGARRMLEGASQSRRVIFPCHNYKHAPVIKSVRSLLAAGVIGKVHLVTLNTFRNTHARGVNEWRPDWRRERRHSGGGIAMDHGSHTLYLAFEWLGSYPTAISAHTSTLGNYDTEDDFMCSLTFPNGVASAHLSWTAGHRKVIYTIHGDRGAIRVEDDDIEVARLSANPIRSFRAEWSVERHSVASDWMDSSHAGWFNSLFNEFKGAIERDDFVGQQAREAFQCVQIIQTGYASALEQSRQLSLAKLGSFEDADQLSIRRRSHL